MLNANQYYLAILELMDDDTEENAAMLNVLLSKLQDEKVTMH